MIKNWFITGDTHGDVYNRIKHISNNSNHETAIIILGDVGLNFFRNSLEYSRTDTLRKDLVNKVGVKVYCVRGNHEMRPKDVGIIMLETFDDNVHGNVYMEPDYPNIRYLMDGGEYEIDGHKTLVIGGAYSVDKQYRLANQEANGFCGWFENEMLTKYEMEEIEKKVSGNHYDFVFTHTAPSEWTPEDTFTMQFPDVDVSMEVWMQNLKEKISFNVWCFGHYHLDRIERPGVECMYMNIQKLQDVWNRWQQYQETGRLDFRCNKSPRFFWD